MFAISNQRISFTDLFSFFAENPETRRKTRPTERLKEVEDNVEYIEMRR